MAEIIPAILEKTFFGVEGKVRRLKGISDKVQIDVADGVFVQEKTWDEPERLSEFGQEIKFEAHLMVDRPEKQISTWSRESVYRIIFHFEAAYDVRRAINLIKNQGKEAGVAINPETSVESIYDIIKEVDMILVMGVDPGGQGRVFDSKAIDKVKSLRAMGKDLNIGVDGGIDPIISKALISAGASTIFSGSYLFSQEDIKEGIRLLGLV